ncbi:FAD-dependent oxidoreductase [soil metagenome]
MKAIVIGSGIIGLCSAYYLLQEGYEVTVIDKETGSANCSSGNLGMIVPSHFVPLASPGIISKGLKWLLNSKSPFYIRPSFDKQLISWGWQFMKNATAENCRKAAEPLAALNVLSRNLYEQLQQEISFDFSYEQKGLIMYYNTDETAEEEIEMAEHARAMGLDATVLTKEALQLLEPNVELNVKGGIHYRCDAHLNPNQLVQQLKSYLEDKGVTMHYNSAITQFNTSNETATGVLVNEKEITADVIVIAAGAWMPAVTSQLGISTPMIAGKGYTFNTANQPKLNTPCILCEARVAITPFGDSIRYGGTMEIGTMNNKVNMNRIEGIVSSANNYFKNINLPMPPVQAVWFGYRPCSPDGLPYIGRLNKFSNVIIAGGHSMMGLSLGAATGKIVSELAGRKKTSTDVSIFNPERFN